MNIPYLEDEVMRYKCDYKFWHDQGNGYAILSFLNLYQKIGQIKLEKKLTFLGTRRTAFQTSRLNIWTDVCVKYAIWKE